MKVFDMEVMQVGELKGTIQRPSAEVQCGGDCGGYWGSFLVILARDVKCHFMFHGSALLVPCPCASAFSGPQYHVQIHYLGLGSACGATNHMLPCQATSHHLFCCLTQVPHITWHPCGGAHEGLTWR